MNRRPLYGVLRWGRTACLFLYLIFAQTACSVGVPGGQTVGVQTLRSAEVLVSESATLPPDSAPWTTTALPERISKPRDTELVGYWYRLHFALGAGAPAQWLYFPRLSGGGAIFVNGHQIGEIPTATIDKHVRWYRPHLLLVPPSVLHPGANTIAVRLATSEPRTSFGEVVVGEQAPLRAAYEQRDFWEHSLASTSSQGCLLAGALLLLFWLRRPQERLYGMFGVCLLFWGLRTFLLQMPIVPMEWYALWRLAYYLSTAGFVTMITLFLLKFSGAVPRLFACLLIGNWVAGCLVFAVVGMPARPFLNSWWLGSFMPFTFYAIGRLFMVVLRRCSWSNLAMGLSVALALILTLHDFAAGLGWFGLQEQYLMHIAMPSFLLVMAGVLSDRFVESLRRAESINEELGLRVGAREAEIAESYRRVQMLERVNAATEERQRIMQDMHDGVGSHLLTTLVMVERGTATREETLQQLQECLDDMRLVIESLAPDDPDLLPVLGNFRHRTEARCRATGMRLYWLNRNLPEQLVVAPHVGLHIMRLLQEALTNVTKHARASTVIIEADFSPTRLKIAVIDDGTGFVSADTGTGHGLRNMRTRAAALDAVFEVEHLATGTAIRLDIPLPGEMVVETAPALAMAMD